MYAKFLGVKYDDFDVDPATGDIVKVRLVFHKFISVCVYTGEVDSKIFL